MKGGKVLKAVLGLFKRGEVRGEEGQKQPVAPSGTRKKLFMAAQVDELTESMTRWIAAAAARVDSASLYVGEAASSENLAKFIENHADDPITLVFYGHGEDDCLLTTATLGTGQLRRSGQCRTLCTAADLGRARDLLVVAFCCLAARALAATLVTTGGRARFLGYRDNISFSMGTASREAAFSGPMEGAVEEVCKQATIDDLILDNLRSAYGQERRRWVGGGEFATDTRAPFVALFLLQHLKFVEIVK